VLLQARAGALQGAVHGCHARVEEPGGVLGGPVENVAKDQHRALPGRKVLDGRHEGQLDRLLGDDRGVWPLVAGGDLLQQAVGVGLQPGDLRPAGRL
jgi:hypothetical protein